MGVSIRRLAFSAALGVASAAPISALAAPAHAPTPTIVASPVVKSAPVEHFADIQLDETLPDGGRLYSQRDSSTFVSGIELFVQAGLDRQASNEGGVAALTAEMLLDTPVSSDQSIMPLQDAVRKHGGTITADITGQSVHFYLEARNSELASLADLCARALATPVFTRETFTTAVDALRPRVEASHANPLTAGTQMFRGSYYATTNAGAPPLGTLADLQRQTRVNASQFYHRAYHVGGASATVIGETSAENKSAAKKLLLSLQHGSSQPVHISARPSLPPQTSIISFRNVTSPWVVLGFPAPSAESEDFAPMLVLSTMIEDAFTRESTTTVPLSQKPVGLEYDFHSNPATLILYVDGGAIDQSMALRELQILRMALGSSALTEQYVERYKNMAAGTYVGSMSTISERAQEIASLANLGLGPDGMNTVLQRISIVKPSDVQRVLKKYIDSSTISLVLPHDQESR
jgi:predicted Zn-dependent peptidase